MIVQRIVGATAAVAVLATAAVVVLVSTVFAVYTLLCTVVTPAAASAVIVGTVALVLGAAGLLLLKKAAQTPAPSKTQSTEPLERQGISGRMLNLAQKRPFLAAGAAVAAGLIAWRNPRLVRAVMSRFEPGEDRI